MGHTGNIRTTRSVPSAVAAASGHRVHEIVVGVDGSAAAVAALHWAAEQSCRTHEPLRVVHAWQLGAAQSEFAAALLEVAGVDARAKATCWVRDALASCPSVRWTLDVVQGPAGPTLVDRSRDASLLVLGTGRHVGVRRMLTGSVSHYVLSHAVPPVVAVRATPEACPSVAPTHARAI